jgi:hypothetical protein
MRNLLLLVIISFGFFTNTQAQKYKDIFPQIIAADEDVAFDILYNYLLTDFDHPNANLRIAKIYIDRYKQADVLRDYERALALAEQAKFKLIKSKVTIDEREVKKNEEYYMGVLDDGQFSFAAISAFIDSEAAAANEFAEKVPPIYKEFTRSVEKYDEAVKSFSDIVGSHASLKELYLLYNQDLSRQLAKLSSDYDSTKVYFDNYLALRDAYKVNAVKQTYSEQPIKVYRLDGLVTQINFLQPKVTLWDYSSWVDSVNVVVEQNIADLRKDLDANEAKLKDALVKVKSVQNPDSFQIARVDKALIFNLMKYDYKNALVPLLSYQEFKQELIKEQRRKGYFDTANITIDRKLAYFSNMMYATKEADSILNEFDTRFDPEQLQRHNEFVQSSFGGTDEMKKYMADEKVANSELFLEQIKSIKEGIEEKEPIDTSGVEAKYKRMVIPIYNVEKPLEELPTGYLKTNYILKSADETIYVAGHQINDTKNQNVEIGIARLSAENKPIWVKAIDLEIDSAGVDANHYLGDVKLTSEGIAVTIRSVALDSSKVINSLVHLTSNGEVKFAKRIKTELFPRELVFIENSNLFIVSYFGEQEKVNDKAENSLTIRAYNGLGEEVWHYDNMLSGTYEKMLTTQNSILIGGNYTRIKNEAGRTFSVTSGTNAYLLRLSLTGGLEAIKCYSSDKGYSIDTFYKVSDRNINMIGPNDEHIIVDGNLEKLYSSVSLKE